AQVSNAGARALACLELREERAAVRLQRAQLVELGGVTLGDHAAVDDARGGIFHQRFAEQRGAVLRRREVGAELSEERRRRRALERAAQRGEQREALAQAGELARPRARR